jgi:hypothetical protein
MYFVFCRLYLFISSHHGSVWVLPVISLLLTNTVSPVYELALSYDGGDFVGPEKKTIGGLLKVHKHDIFLKYFFCRNQIFMVPRACNTRFLKILFDSAEIFDF